MKSGLPQNPSARLFVALGLPEPVRASLARWGARELVDPALRPVAPESLHMTLCFLGPTDEGRIREVKAVVTGIEANPIEVRFRGPPAGRPSRRPGFWAVEADAPAAVRLQAELSSSLASLGVLEPEPRPFWPHVTVARVRTEPGSGRRPRRVRKSPGELPATLTEPFGAVRVSLYRSTLRPEGAKYVPLANLDLPPTA